MKVVLDTNVFVSGLILPDSQPGKIISAWENNSFLLVSCEELLAEVGRTLRNNKIQKRLHWSDAKIARFLLSLKYLSILVDIAGVTVRVSRDKTDDFLIALLVKSQADYLVTGDNDLLSLRGDFPIVFVREFVSLL